jgi:hypothetical protein
MAIKHLGSLSGTGTLRAGSIAISGIEYRIDVLMDGRFKSGQGFIFGDFTRLISWTGKTILELNDGNTVQINLDQISPGEEKAIVSTSGPVPGF